jgi:hypothetical protein
MLTNMKHTIKKRTQDSCHIFKYKLETMKRKFQNTNTTKFNQETKVKTRTITKLIKLLSQVN